MHEVGDYRQKGYIDIYILYCTCLCVQPAREREREKERVKNSQVEGERVFLLSERRRHEEGGRKPRGAAAEYGSTVVRDEELELQPRGQFTVFSESGTLSLSLAIGPINEESFLSLLLVVVGRGKRSLALFSGTAAAAASEKRKKERERSQEAQQAASAAFAGGAGDPEQPHSPLQRHEKKGM